MFSIDPLNGSLIIYQMLGLSSISNFEQDTLCIVPLPRLSVLPNTNDQFLRTRLTRFQLHQRFFQSI